jgi:hypothetical protein
MDWTRIRIAASGTHHLLDDRPIYDARFDEVLTFHAPGLAPVRRGALAWHIDPSGQPAYTRRFQRCFGFYDERAAVISTAGPDGVDAWHHIRPDGTDVYPQRYAWCGNFQGGRCAVRDTDHRYLHIDRDGQPAYAARWRYAGDFRDGVGVVQAEDGRSTHIEADGRLVHERWFLDLDVFHKGLARARDELGWMHIDRSGHPVYGRRFAMVEPFYNGLARVERVDGALEVIDERAQVIVTLRARGHGAVETGTHRSEET